MSAVYIGSFGPRYGDTHTCVAATAEQAEAALEAALEFELAELPTYCDVEHDPGSPEWECAFCNPDLVLYGVFAETHPVRYGFMTAGELRQFVEFGKEPMFLER